MTKPPFQTKIEKMVRRLSGGPCEPYEQFFHAPSPLHATGGELRIATSEADAIRDLVTRGECVLPINDADRLTAMTRARIAQLTIDAKMREFWDGLERARRLHVAALTCVSCGRSGLHGPCPCGA